MWSRLLCVAALLGAVSAQQQYTGDLTTYTLSSPISGNCNFMTAPTGASQNYAAINAAQWDATKSCGRCAQVSCADSRCKDTTTAQIVYILDQCPECKQGDLDVSPSVFKAVTGNDPGRYKIKWSFVDCPVTGNLKYCLKTGSNAYYAAIQPANSAAAVKSMTINTKATTMVPSAYYYLLESNIDLKAVQVSLTSTSGETVTETVSLTAGQCTTGTSQFKASGSAPASPAVTPATTPATPATTPSTPATAAPTTKAPTTSSAPTPRPIPTTKKPSNTPRPPRTESTKTPSPSPAADADGDDDDEEDEDKTTTAPATTSAPATTTAAPASNTTTAPATTTPPPATTTAPVPATTTSSATTPAPAATTKAPMAPSTPSPTKKVSCRRLED